MHVKESNNIESERSESTYSYFFLFIKTIICDNFITFQKEIVLSPRANMSTVYKFKNYGSIELQQYRMMMNKHPGTLSLNA